MELQLMGLLQNMQEGQGAPQADQQAGDDPMQKALMDMLGATLMGDGGEAVASRIGAGEDKIQGVAEAVGSGIYTILKQARDAGRSVPAKNIVKALYEGCREMLAAGKIDDADSKIDALARALAFPRDLFRRRAALGGGALGGRHRRGRAVRRRRDRARRSGVGGSRHGIAQEPLT